MAESNKARVALVVVSHSSKIADGTKELSQAMAPDVFIGAAGGDPSGGLGSSFDLIESVVNEALEASAGKGVVVLTDLGSATLTVDTVLEFADEPDLLKYAPGPLVEGAVAGSIAAQGGADVQGVVDAVADAARTMCPDDLDLEAQDDTEPLGIDPKSAAEFDAVVADAAGLHARPAAKIAAMVADSEADVWIDGADCGSPLELMSLGAKQGRRVVVRAEGPGAAKIASAVAAAISAGLDN